MNLISTLDFVHRFDSLTWVPIIFQNFDLALINDGLVGALVLGGPISPTEGALLATGFLGAGADLADVAGLEEFPPQLVFGLEKSEDAPLFFPRPLFENPFL